MMQNKIVIFAPHQDDEILGCYQLIRSHPQEVYVVFLTNGDYEGAEVARTRWAESTAALTHLGVPENHMIALGYADTGMAREVSFLWRLWHDEEGVTLPSAVGAQTYHPAGGQEFHLARTGRHAPYTRAAVLEDVQAVLETLRPAAVYMPNEFDLHGDHAAAPLFVSAAIEAIADYHPLVYRYHIHGGDDTRWPNRQGDHFVQPMNMPHSQWEIRQSMPVSDREDFARTLWMFPSQMGEAEYMLSFVKEEQLYFAPVYHHAPDEA